MPDSRSSETSLVLGGRRQREQLGGVEMVHAAGSGSCGLKHVPCASRPILTLAIPDLVGASVGALIAAQIPETDGNGSSANRLLCTRRHSATTPPHLKHPTSPSLTTTQSSRG